MPALIDRGAVILDYLARLGRKDTYKAKFEALMDAFDNAPYVESGCTPVTGDTSDGYHTFNELYHHRAVLFSVIVKMFQHMAWKSRKHHDGSMYDGMFIVGIDTPDGQATYHYDINPYWDMFECEELDKAPEWDGHTPEQAIERVGKLVPYSATRCRDCRYWQAEASPSEHWVCLHHSTIDSRFYSIPSFFCADGCKREEASR